MHTHEGEAGPGFKGHRRSWAGGTLLLFTLGPQVLAGPPLPEQPPVPTLCAGKAGLKDSFPVLRWGWRGEGKLQWWCVLERVRSSRAGWLGLAGSSAEQLIPGGLC